MILLAGKPAVVQAFTADTADPSGVDAHESFKGALGPTEELQEPHIS